MSDPRGTILEPAQSPRSSECGEALEASSGSINVCNAIVAPAHSFLPCPVAAPVQPVSNVPAYLAQRKPVAHFSAEKSLFITLRDDLRSELRTLLGTEPGRGAFGMVQSLINDGLSTDSACRKALSVFSVISCSKSRFRARFDLWRKSQDWLVLVNRAKAGAAWQDRKDGLPDAFIKEVCAPYFAKFGRRDAKRQAILAIKRWWRTGKDLDGTERAMPGYEGVWATRPPELYPTGWHYSNILRQVKANSAFTAPVRALLHEGVAAAKEFLPQHLGTRTDLRFLEEVTFDDVRTDWLIFDPESGQPCELWLLVARDAATAMVLGFVMHPSRAREDGSDTHLGHREMKQLAAWLLERYPLPPYICTWKIERGTATLSEGSARAIQEMLPDRIKVSYTSMIGGRSPAGYQEKAKGNSRGKASHESHNRLFHTQAAYIPGQTGARYELRPADLKSRADECVEIWSLRNRLPEHLRGTEQYPLLLPGQAREHLTQFCLDQNFRTDHKLEGFAEVLEWFDASAGKWMPSNTYPGRADCPQPAVATLASNVPTFRRRMEMPVERAIKLMAGHQWTKVSPDVIIAFLSHTARSVTIEPSGEIEFQHEGTRIRFAAPVGRAECPHPAANAKCLGYFNPSDAAFLHVTTGQGSILGTWFRRQRIGHKDHELLEQAMRYTANALKAAQDYAAQLMTPEREKLDAMRAHNTDLERGNDFIDVGPEGRADCPQPALASHIANVLATHVPRFKDQAKAEEESIERTAEILRRATDNF